LAHLYLNKFATKSILHILYKFISREPAQHASTVCAHNRQAALSWYARLHNSTESVAS